MRNDKKILKIVKDLLKTLNEVMIVKTFTVNTDMTTSTETDVCFMCGN